MALMELAVDFGSSYITIYKRGEGIVLKEASVVVVSTHKKKREVVESGNAAKNYVRTTMGNAREIYPVREGRCERRGRVAYDERIYQKTFARKDF